MAGFRARYGAQPLHLIGHLLLFVVAGWAINQILDGGNAINWLAWFLGAALLHDLVLLPLYSVIDRALDRGARRDTDRAPHPMLNHLRVPAVVAGIVLLVYLPLILGLSSTNYRNDTGHRLAGYTRNWLLITAALFGVSALVYLARRLRPRPASPGGRPRA